MARYDEATNTYTLVEGQEDFTMPANPAAGEDANVIGNGLSNTIIGNDGENEIDGDGGGDSLVGGLGHDILNGGSGADTLEGGDDGDTYIVDDSGDIVVEEENSEGIDIVQASVTFTLGNYVEELRLTGTGNISGTGNALANVIIGNSGNNTLNGGEGADEMTGGLGDDTYIVDNDNDLVIEEGDEGHDTVRASVSFSLQGTTVEELFLTGTAAEGIGNHLENKITGNAIGNTLDGGEGSDTLDGGLGADELIGGLGNDTFVVDNIDDLVTELLDEGNDTIEASVSFTLSDHVENLFLTGSGNIAGTGNNDANELKGNSGNNRLDGGGGADRMTGGLGNDTYIVDNENDVVIESGDEGHDSVESSVTFELTGTTVEDLILTGSDSINGTGNNLNNKIVGTSGSNNLIGHEGNDTLDGGEGADNLAGGIGDDTYVINSEDDVIIEDAGDANDKVISAITFSLANTELEHLELTGTAALNGTGNAAKNRITGNSGANILSGAEGDDTLDGGNGADSLEGGSGNDLLQGGAGADIMIGGEGDDLYVVNSAEDVISEDASGGSSDKVTSKISYVLGTNVEYLNLENGFGNLSGTGNALNNTIFGNDGNNVIDGGAGTDTLTGASGNDTVYGGDGDDVINEYENGNDFLNGGNGSDQINAEGGNDTLDGGTGADTLKGGAGDDTYMVDSDADVLIEDAGQGTDTVIASGSYTLKAGISVEIFSAQQGTAAINLTGNELNNVINGNAGSNVLDGSVGADMLAGGAGDDTYMVDNALDIVTEINGQGTDTIVTSINLALTSKSSVEVLAASAGGLAINLTGNETANTLKGNDGNNVLNGGLGKDVLSGGAGVDIFVFDKKANKSTNLDRITDYDVKNDSIHLESNFFKKVGKGTLTKPGKVKKDFFSLKGHKDKNDYLAYNKKTGVLTFDADGSGKTKAVEIAVLNKNLKMTEKEFFII